MQLTRFAAFLAVGFTLAACGGGVSNQVVPAKKVALLLPDTTNARYEAQDRPLFQAKLRSLCQDCQVIYRNANGDAAAQLQQAEYALGAGAGVLVLDPVDAGSAAAIAGRAANHHVPVVAYDGLVANTSSLSYFIGFDQGAIGALQGGALLAALKTPAQASVVMLNGDPADRDAGALKKAVHKAIDGKVTVAKEFDVAAASSDGAQLEMAQALTALKGKVDAVYGANDEIASGAVAAMKQAGLKTLPPVTGGDTELSAVQRIISGEQYMTVYRPVRQEAEAAAQVAYDLVYGVAVPSSLVTANSVNNGSADVPAVLIQPVAVTRRTLISTVIADGFWTRADICTAAYTQACRAAGLS